MNTLRQGHKPEPSDTRRLRMGLPVIERRPSHPFSMDGVIPAFQSRHLSGSMLSLPSNGGKCVEANALGGSVVPASALQGSQAVKSPCGLADLSSTWLVRSPEWFVVTGPARERIAVELGGARI